MPSLMRKLTIGLIVVVALLAVYLYLIKPASEDTVLKTEPQQTAQVLAGEVASDESVAEEKSATRRRQKMEHAYSGLEQARRSLKSKANMLKSLSWGINLPSAQAQQISHKMREVFVYLKNPPMLGAYYEVADITREIRKIESMMAGLEKAELDLQAARTTQVSPQ